MNSNSQSANSADTYSQRLADIVGTAIALLTLTLPVFVIAHYSSSNLENNQQPLIQNLQGSKD
ncbi:TLTLP motif-containing protein [Nostoc sp.]